MSLKNFHFNKGKFFTFSISYSQIYHNFVTAIDSVIWSNVKVHGCTHLSRRPVVDFHIHFSQRMRWFNTSYELINSIKTIIKLWINKFFLIARPWLGFGKFLIHLLHKSSKPIQFGVWSYYKHHTLRRNRVLFTLIPQTFCSTWENQIMFLVKVPLLSSDMCHVCIVTPEESIVVVSILYFWWKRNLPFLI